MAQIRLKTNECVRGYLPLVCAACGQQADDSKAFKFSRIPVWMYLLFFVSGIPCVITAVTVHLAVLTASLLWVVGVFILRRSVIVDLPVCRPHRRNYGLRSLALAVLVPVVVILIFAVIGVPLLATRRGGSIEGWGLCVLPVILFIALGMTAIAARGRIRVTYISPHSVTLKGVHTHFVDVVRELRDAKYDEEPELRSRPARPRPLPG